MNMVTGDTDIANDELRHVNGGSNVQSSVRVEILCNLIVYIVSEDTLLPYLR
jgi:hypothetical protein